MDYASRGGGGRAMLEAQVYKFTIWVPTFDGKKTLRKPIFAFEVPRQGLSRTARSGGFYPSFLRHGRDSNLIELGFNVAGRCGLY